MSITLSYFPFHLDWIVTLLSSLLWTGNMQKDEDERVAPSNMLMILIL